MVDFKITTIKTLLGFSRPFVFVDVEFLNGGGGIIHQNDFLMDIRPTYDVYIGSEGPDGEILEPGNYETRTTDVVTEILANIDSYLSRIAGLPDLLLDNRDPSIEADNSDPLGLLAAPGVADLVGVVQVQ